MAKHIVPEAKYADIGGDLRIHYHEAGSGDPVIFLHGSGPGASGWSNFKGNFPYFAERGLRAVVPDMVGYGYSSKPKDFEFDLERIAETVLAFMDALGIDQAALVGNSMGGAVCIRMALMKPERVSKLVLMAPGGLEEREVYMKMDGIMTMMRCIYGEKFNNFREGFTEEGMRKVFELQIHDASILTDETLAERLQIAQLQPLNVFKTLRVGYLAPELEHLACPIYALWGVGDQFCPVSGATTIAKSCTNARVTMLTECGHWVMVEHEDYFNRTCCDFLLE